MFVVRDTIESPQNPKPHRAGSEVKPGPYERQKHALFSRLDLASAVCFLVVTPVSNRKASRLESGHSHLVLANVKTSLSLRLEPPPSQCFQWFACVSNNLDLRLEIGAAGFVRIVTSTRRRSPTSAPDCMLRSSICTDLARAIADFGEPAPGLETTDYWMLTIAELINGQWY